MNESLTVEISSYTKEDKLITSEKFDIPLKLFSDQMFIPIFYNGLKKTYYDNDVIENYEETHNGFCEVTIKAFNKKLNAKVVTDIKRNF
jgi:hypothetical protein